MKGRDPKAPYATLGPHLGFRIVLVVLVLGSFQGLGLFRIWGCLGFRF